LQLLDLIVSSVIFSAYLLILLRILGFKSPHIETITKTKGPQI